MEFDITEVKNLSGPRAHVYSVILGGDKNTLLEQFFDENKNRLQDLKKVVHKISVMANNAGCLKNFFKEGEGALGDGMVALKGTGQLRLYGIYFHDSVILFGSGGHKPPGIEAYQDYPPLNAKAQLMREIAKEINKMIKEKELKVNKDGTLEM